METSRDIKEPIFKNKNAVGLFLSHVGVFFSFLFLYGMQLSCLQHEIKVHKESFE